jgi:Ser/Thr protein kinase RdoA (MazF antagonist)
MHSDSKIPLPLEAVQAIVTHQFGNQRRLVAFEELKEGYFNAAARLELDDGLRVVLKAAPPPGMPILRYERDILRVEVESLRLVGAQTGVPVPQVLAYDPSRRLLESEYFLMECLPGTPFHKLRPVCSAEQQEVVELEMGRLAREIGSLHGSAFGYFAQPTPAGVSWRECFAGMLQGVLQDGEVAGVGLPMTYAEMYGLLEAHFGVLETVTIPQLVHWDLWDGNVFVDPATYAITGLIDFERALWGDPLMEAIFRVPEPRGAYARGYGGELLGAPGATLRRSLYNVYLYLIMIIECTYRRYETDAQERWSRARLDEELVRL